MLPTVTVTLTPPSEPVSPLIMNPAAFSAMFTVSSPAMVSRFSASDSSSTLVTDTAGTLMPA